MKAPRRGARKTAVKNAGGSASSHNGNGKLPSLSEGKIDFVMRSFEAAIALPAEKPVDVAETVVRGARQQKD